MLIWDNIGATPSKSGTHMIEQESKKYTSTKKVNRDSQTLSLTQSGKVANFAF
jgi:hypothetical protein